MIQIQNNKERDIELISIEHYNEIKSFIEKRLSKSRFRREIKFQLLNYLKDVIVSKPKDLLIIEDEVYKSLNKYQLSEEYIKIQLKKIFNYGAFSKRGTNNWNPYTLASKLNINTCLYCNRQYTFTISKSGKKLSRPQFDHFYPKEKHPLLALSFYNLIPCCSICNGMKKDIDIRNKLLNPYESGFNDNARFTYIPANFKSLIGQDDKMKMKILINQNTEDSNQIIEQIEMFGLETVYTEHADYVQEIVWKSYVSNKGYLKWFNKKFGSGLSENDLFRFSFGNYSELKDLDKRVLSKLTLDLIEELKIKKTQMYE